jgi:peptidyl-prolyl cis-trans isomerase C
MKSASRVSLEHLQPNKGENLSVISSFKKLTCLIFLIILAGLCFPQTSSKTTKTQPKSAPQAPSATSKSENPATATPASSEVIPPADPNALFPAVVARVNGKPILGRELERQVRGELATIGSPEWKNLREDYREQLVYSFMQSLISAELIYQKASASGYKAVETEVQAEFQKIAKSFKSDAEMNIALASEFTDRASLEKDIGKKLVIGRYVEENVAKKISVAPEEVEKYYTANPKEFNHPDIVRTSQILIQLAGDTPEQDALAKKRAEELLARIKKGEDFAKLAKENSMDASASQGGDLGFASKEALDPEYSEAAFSLPVGGMKIVKSQYGYHVIKVTEKKKEGLATLEEVKPSLTDFLKNQKSQAEIKKLIEQLRDQAKVEILIPIGQPLVP